jgi:hypothetical protein
MPLNTGVSAADLGVNPDLMQPINPEQAAPIEGPDTAPNASAQARQPAAAPLGGGAPPSPVAPQKYNPEKALEEHLRKLHPDLEPEHLDFAKNYYRGKMQKEAFKKMGKEHRGHATEYMVSLRDYDRTLHAAEKDAEELSMLKKSYEGEVAGAGGTPPPGLIHPKDDPQLQARFTKTKAAVLAADARRKAAWDVMQKHYKKTTGHELDEKHALSPMAIRMLMMGDDKELDPTEDLVDEHVRSR